MTWFDVCERFCITVDTKKEVEIYVRLDDVQYIKFIEIGSGLYICNHSMVNDHSNKGISGYLFLTLVSKISYILLDMNRMEQKTPENYTGQ